VRSVPRPGSRVFKVASVVSGPSAAAAHPASPDTATCTSVSPAPTQQTATLPACDGQRTVSDADDVRRLALSLAGVEEIDSRGFDFRVGGKGFVWSYPERIPGRRRVLRTDIAVLYVGDEAEKQALLLGEPELFFTVPGYDGFPLVMVRLERVTVDRLAELVVDAWGMRRETAGPGR